MMTSLGILTIFIFLSSFNKKGMLINLHAPEAKLPNFLRIVCYELTWASLNGM